MFKINEQTRKWWILIGMTTAYAMIFLGITILPVALPTIQRDLPLSQIGMQWIINAYTLALAVFILASGRLGDTHGHRKLFFWGLVVFVLGTILCGMSFSQGWFIGARFIQGAGAAIISPSCTALTFNGFPEKERGTAIGIFIGMGSIFLALGPFVGGVISEYLSWRFIFWINIPIALISYLLARLTIPSDFAKSPKHEHFDWGGFLTGCFGISAIVVALMQAQVWGWLAPMTIFLLVLGGFLIASLVKIDRGIEDPFFDFSLFKCKSFVGSCLSIAITQFILMVTVFWAIYFQNIFGFGPTKVGILILLSSAPIIFLAPLGIHLLDKRGPRLPIALGFFLVTASLLWFVQNIDDPRLSIILSAIIPFGCGLPLILTPSLTAALSGVPSASRGLASGTISTLRQVGGTLGIALIGTLFFVTQMGHFTKDIKENTETVHIKPSEFEGLLAKTPSAVAKLKTLTQKEQEVIQQSYEDAYKRGFSAINIFATVMGGVGLLSACILIKDKKQPQL